MDGSGRGIGWWGSAWSVVEGPEQETVCGEIAQCATSCIITRPRPSVRPSVHKLCDVPLAYPHCLQRQVDDSTARLHKHCTQRLPSWEPPRVGQRDVPATCARPDAPPDCYGEVALAAYPRQRCFSDGHYGRGGGGRQHVPLARACANGGLQAKPAVATSGQKRALFRNFSFSPRTTAKHTSTQHTVTRTHTHAAHLETRPYSPLVRMTWNNTVRAINALHIGTPIISLSVSAIFMSSRGSLPSSQSFRILAATCCLPDL